MGIAINKAENYRHCNICSSKNNVVEIIFRNETISRGTAVALCEDCVRELKLKLDLKIWMG